MADALPAPAFHHLHLNSVDPEAAITFYTEHFPSTSGTTWDGKPALASPNNVLILFDRVLAPPATSPDTAYWHFGWHVSDAHGRMRALKDRTDVRLMPLYTGDGDGAVFISSDTWPAVPGTLARTRQQVAEAKASGVEPRRKGGWTYMQGPDGALVELAGDFDSEFFNHVHMFHDEPWCAQLWYREHLGASAMRGREGAAALDENTCRVERAPDPTFPSLVPSGTFRTPAAGVAFGDVTLSSYKPQGDRPLAPTRGHLCDHIALGVANLDAWAAKLRAEGITFLEEPHRFGHTRAFMIEGPSREAIELVEA